MSTARKLVKNFASLTFAEAITRLCAMLLYIYIARVLGVTSFGQLAFATAVIGFFNFFADFGLTTLGIREIARDKDHTNSLGTNILLFQIILTIFLLLVLALILIVSPISDFLKWITFIYGLGIIPLSLDMSYIFQAHEKMEFVLWGKSIGQISYLALGFIFITLTKNIMYLPISSLLGGMVGAIISFQILHQKILFRFAKPDFNIIKNLAIVALPFFLAGILSNVYHNMDSVMLQFIKSSSEVGYYASGYKVVNILIMVVSFISNAFFPMIAASFKDKPDEFRKHNILFAKIIGIIAIPLALGGMVFASNILILLYGPSYAVATGAFRILLLLVIVIPFNILISSLLIASDMQKQYMIAGAIGAILNILLNLLLIPRYGMIGAGIATVITEVAVGTCLAFASRSHASLFIQMTSSFFIKPGIAALVMCLIISMVNNLILGVIIGTILYSFVTVIIGGIPSEILAKAAPFILTFQNKIKNEKSS